MKIAFRTSGGRGEYELAGRQEGRASVALAGFSFDFQLTPHLIVPGKCFMRIDNGKPRVRLTEGRSTARHAAYWLSAVLMLGEPSRVRSDAPQQELVSLNLGEGFQVSGIKVDVASVDEAQKHCVLRPTVVEVNQHGLIVFVSVPERLGRVQAVLDRDDSSAPVGVRAALVNFRQVFQYPTSHPSLIKAFASLKLAVDLEAVGGVNDVLVYLEDLLGVGLFTGDSSASEVSAEEDDSRTPIQIRSDYVRAWREVADRGYKGRRFSQDVLAAYNHVCLVSGLKLPRTSVTTTAGVDAAHILPWARYDLDVVHNGLCLSKNFHWAFDAGVIKIKFDPACNQYIRFVDKDLHSVLAADGFDTSFIDSHLGPVPVERLPVNHDFWPDPGYLDEYNKIMSAV